MERNSKTPLYHGMIGGGIVISIFLTILLSVSLFNYRVQVNKISINTIQNSDSTILISPDSLHQFQQSVKEQLMENLKKDKSILSPQEYTNNVVNYYNSILLILSLMLAAFSFLGFVYIKSQALDIIDEKLRSDGFREEVVELLVGRAEDSFRENWNAISSELEELQNRIARYEEDSEGNETEIEE